jgi:hypothetical protein
MLKRGSEKFREVMFTPNKIEDSITAGSIYNKSIKIYSIFSQPLELVPETDLENLEPNTVNNGETIISYSISPILSGTHTSKLRGQIQDSNKIFLASNDLDISLGFKVYPRVYPVAVAAIQYLLSVGPEGEAPTILTKRGKGGEYAYTRQYEPGDPLNVFDWKAYAKTGKPMVKEFYDEAGGGINIIYDPLVLDRISLDELNSEFLKTVLTYVQAKTPINLLILDKNSLKQVASKQIDALTIALKITLEYVIEDFFEYYSVLEPTRVDKVRKILGVKNPKSLKIKQPLGEVIIVSSLQGNPAKIIDMIRKTQRSNTRIIQPTKTWLYAKDLSKSVRIYLDYSTKIKTLEKIGLKIYSDIIEAEPWLI